MTAQDRLINAIESHHCPNSTDAGGRESNHYVKGGICLICDRSVWGLSILTDSPNK